MGKSYSSAEIQSVYFATPADWANGVMAKALDCHLQENEFKLKSLYYVHFWTNAPGERHEPFSLLPAVLLCVWIWH